MRAHWLTKANTNDRLTIWHSPSDSTRAYHNIMFKFFASTLLLAIMAMANDNEREL